MRAERWIWAAAVLAACGGSASGAMSPSGGAGYGQLERLQLNQLAMRLELPLFWAADADEDAQVDPDEVRGLLFYPAEVEWVREGRFTEAFDRAYQAMVETARASAPEDARLRLVHEELGYAMPTLLETDLGELPPVHRAFAERMLRVATLLDRLYARQVGMDALASRVEGLDPASRSVFRRNWGPACRAPSTESNPACSAIPGAPKQPVDVYPASLQERDDFCASLETHPRASALLSPFTVVRERAGELVAVPYHEAYAELMGPIASELEAAVAIMTDPAEEPLRRYLRAAAQAFRDNRWEPADEAWAAMSVRNSRWYVRVAPDEVYWEPCSQKAGFHLTFARIDQSSLTWQERLTPLQTRMETSLSALVAEYRARDVSFHMPDFIAIVVNAGDDRDPFGATIGQSLPNWGPVAEEGRGRTVAMSNLYTDEDSRRVRREQAASLLSAETMRVYSDAPQAGLLSTILHEATHNLGPSHEYRGPEGQTSSEAFGGGMASMLEELKAQSGALFYLPMLREAGVIGAEQEREAYLDSIVWAFGHVSRGMYTASGQRKAYSQLAAIQVGFLMDRGVLRWEAGATAANGLDQGAFTIDFAAFPAVARQLMEAVVRIKATNDRAAAEALAARYVDGETVPQAAIAERLLRFPRQSFVYAVHR